MCNDSKVIHYFLTRTGTLLVLQTWENGPPQCCSSKKTHKILSYVFQWKLCFQQQLISMYFVRLITLKCLLQQNVNWSVKQTVEINLHCLSRSDHVCVGRFFRSFFIMKIINVSQLLLKPLLKSYGLGRTVELKFLVHGKMSWVLTKNRSKRKGDCRSNAPMAYEEAGGTWPISFHLEIFVRYK